jgi:hypothetical protein
VTEHIRPDGRIEREAMHAVADGVDQDGRGTVDDVAGGDLLAARLQHPFFDIRGVFLRGPAQDRKRRPHADADVDVGRAVQGIENDRVIGVGRAEIDDHRMLVFFRSEQANAVPQTEAVQQDFVGVNVQLLLRLPLDVGAAVRSQQIPQPGAAHLGLDQFRGQRDPRQQPGKLAGRAGKPPLLLQDVLLDGDNRPVIQPRQGLAKCLPRFRFRWENFRVAHVG